MYGALAQEREINLRSARGGPHDRRAIRFAQRDRAGDQPACTKDIAVDLKRLDEDLGANVLQERLVATLSGFFGAPGPAARRAWASTA